MTSRVGFAAFALTVSLVMSACSDPTAPRPDEDPSFRRNGGSGGTITMTQCTGVLPPGTYDHVIVPPGASCTVNGSLIRGNVLALADSRLFMSADEVLGFIKGDGADIVHILGTTVADQIFIHNGSLSGAGGVLNVWIAGGTVVTGGNIHVENMQADIISIVNTTVANGSIELFDNATETFLQSEFNTVSANVDVFRNGGAGGKFITNNTAGVAVRCFDNTGAFVIGGPNVAPSREGQCF
ncbi:MAG TPA: hypothetical protein VJ650_12035 [Gemmatimonadaceae bacterium]|nr:hypothetical protein [Gemmatimonadaceae bacterium]